MTKDRLYLESIRNLEVIGEATKNLSEDLRDANPSIPWLQIAGMRDVLIHDYLKVNLNRVWRTVEIDLPPLDTVALFRAIGAALLAVEEKIRAHLQQARRHSPPWPAPVR